MLGRVARDLVRDGVEGQRLLRLEQDEHEVGDTFEPIEFRGGLHRREPTAAAPLIAAGHPFDWHLHLFWLLAFPVLVGRVLVGHSGRDVATPAPEGALRRSALLVLVLAVTWPLGDLAAHWLLVALVLQRLLLTLAVPPLLVLGTPRPLIARLTRPAPVDAVLRVAVRPAPAVAIVTVIAVATLTTGAVNLAARSDVARVVIELVVLPRGSCCGPRC